eukprot:2711603-Pleurochrysis_carterae.AAC.1
MSGQLVLLDIHLGQRGHVEGNSDEVVLLVVYRYIKEKSISSMVHNLAEACVLRNTTWCTPTKGVRGDKKVSLHTISHWPCGSLGSIIVNN